MKFLICDDSILARKQLKDAISAHITDAELIEAKDGKECVELFIKENPDLIFIDIVMPVLDGVSAVDNIIKANPEAKVIIVSSVGTQKELKAAIDAGASDFIQKPFSKAQIKEILEYYLK